MHKGWISTNQQFNSLKNKNPEKKTKKKDCLTRHISHTSKNLNYKTAIENDTTVCCHMISKIL